MALKRMAAARALWQITRDVRRPGAPGLRERLAAIPRMIGLSLVGRYPQLSRGRLALIVAGAAYVLSPIDLIPEVLVPLVGWADDAVVLAWLVGALLAETEAFLAWEAARGRVVPGEVVGGGSEPLGPARSR